MVATSFPYLRVSREYGVRYEAVLRAVQMLDDGVPTASLTAGRNPPMWVVATVAAWLREGRRRMLMTDGRWPSATIDLGRVRAQWRIPEAAVAGS